MNNFTRWVLLGFAIHSVLLLVANVAETSDSDELIDYVFNSSDVFDENADDTDDNCVCLPFTQCINGTVNKGGIDLIGLRFGQPSCGRLELCCKVPKKPGVQSELNLLAASAIIPTTQTTPVTSQQTLVNSLTTLKVTQVTPLDSLSSEPSSNSGHCGIRYPGGVGFRIQGASYKAQFGEFPWMIAILNRDIKENGEAGKLTYNCGGSLIHPQVVLTSAHNIDKLDANSLWVRAGEWDLDSIQERIPHQSRRVSKVVFHKGYNPSTAYYDIALLLLEEAFDLSSNVNIVCLPHPNETVFEGECVTSGWGADSYDSNVTFQNILKQTSVPIVPRDKCEVALRDTRLGSYFELHKSFICAGGEKGDACLGDGGSPLTCSTNNGEKLQYQQVGIVSWGIGCGSSAPGVYVNVARFIPWINKNMIKFGLKPKYNDW